MTEGFLKENGLTILRLNDESQGVRFYRDLKTFFKQKFELFEKYKNSL